MLLSCEYQFSCNFIVFLNCSLQGEFDSVMMMESVLTCCYSQSFPHFQSTK